MSGGDVDAIGTHCQYEYCHVLDFLPFTCSSCSGKFCVNHLNESAHECKSITVKTETQKKDTKKADESPTVEPGEECSETSCKKRVKTNHDPWVQCPSCTFAYCITHRMPEEHNCKEKAQSITQSSGGVRLSALVKLRLWAEQTKKEEERRRSALKKSSFFNFGKSPSPAAKVQAELSALKRAAKGDVKIPQEKRIYLNVEASADTTKAKYPTGKFFYHKDWVVGKVLDMAAKALQVENVNNRSDNPEDMLRVFHVQGGRLLKHSEKIGDPCATGNMIVLLRGVGAEEANLIDL